MRAGERAGGKPTAWGGAADGRRRRAYTRKPARIRREERRAKTQRVAVVLSLFLVLLAAALLVGGRAIVQPLLQSAMGAGGVKRVGQIVYSLPDKTLCRHVSFDNETAEVSEGAVTQCPANLTKGRGRGDGNFSWGGR